MSKDPEVRFTYIICIVATVFFTVIGSFLNKEAGLIALCMGLTFSVFLIYRMRCRKRRIEELTKNIDVVLHSDTAVLLEDNREGELAVLESEIHKMTIMIREQNAALAQDKIFLKDSIADISHQIRTPLTAINLLITLLRKPDITFEERSKYLRSVDANLTRIEWLISSLLKMSKIDAGTAGFKYEMVNVSSLMKRAIEPLLISAELRDQLLDFVSSGRETFMGDINWSTEAIGNIIKNCTEHTPEGGHIEVLASENTLFTEIIIQDNGPGISEKDLGHIFERFYKGSNAGSNSVGIGLALSRMIVVSQNGTIKAENRPEGGACFTIRFYKREKILR